MPAHCKVIFFNPYADHQVKGAARRIQFLSHLLDANGISHTSILKQDYAHAPKSLAEKALLRCGLGRIAFFLHAAKLCRDKNNIVISEVIFTPTWLGNMVLTVHDLKAYDPKATRGGLLRRFAYLVFTRLARQVVVVSESVRHDMATLCGIDPAKVHVIPNGISMHHLALAAQYRRQEPGYDFIYVSSFARHKRHALLLRAAPAGSRICLIGRDLGSLQEIRQEMQGRAGEISVDILDNIDTDEDLFKLLGQARTGVFPSVFEGFGIPILEYGAAGLHVIASDIPPFRELASYIDQFVAPDDENALRHALSTPRAMTPPDRAAKTELVAKGSFTEEAIGRKLVGFLDDIAKG